MSLRDQTHVGGPGMSKDNLISGFEIGPRKFVLGTGEKPLLTINMDDWSVDAPTLEDANEAGKVFVGSVRSHLADTKGEPKTRLATQSDYPLCNRLQANITEVRAIHDFLEWLRANGMQVCEVKDYGGLPLYHPTGKSDTELAEGGWLGLDLTELEKERAAMLEDTRDKAAEL